MSNLNRNDDILIDAFIEHARALMPHQDDLHDIDPERFIRGDISLQDIEDYFFHQSEYLGGMAAVINATIEAGIEVADQIGV